MIKKGTRIQLLGIKNYLVTAENKKFSTQYGQIDLGKLIGKKFGTKIKSHMGEKFVVVEPSTPDILRKIKRAPQIITFKDAGSIISLAGLNKNSVVVEAGGGSGNLTIMLAGICKKVHTYEIREDFHKVVKENLEKNKIKNVVLKNSSVAKCKEREVDAVILDLGEPEEFIETARKALKPGGYLIIYSPVIEQLQRVDLSKFTQVKTIENILREWDIGNNKTRPKTRMLGHTAFLTFARKI